MNRRIKVIVALVMAVALMIPVGAVSAFAAGSDASVIKNDAAVGTKIFDGYKVAILDQITPATSVRGRTTGRNGMCFVSAADKEVGTISYSDYNAIIKKNSKVVALPGGGSYGAPPVEGKSWEEWFADEFNKYRGISATSKEVSISEAGRANASANAELVKE